MPRPSGRAIGPFAFRWFFTDNSGVCESWTGVFPSVVVNHFDRIVCHEKESSALYRLFSVRPSLSLADTGCVTC